jgi:hypothetical protein
MNGSCYEKLTESGWYYGSPSVRLFCERCAVLARALWTATGHCSRFLLEVCVSISSVASAVYSPTYQSSNQSSCQSATSATSSNPLQSVARFASDVSSAAASVVPVIGLLGSIIDVFV